MARTSDTRPQNGHFLLLLVGVALAGCPSNSSNSPFPLNPTTAAPVQAGSFYSNAAIGLTVTQFPWVFTPKTAVDGGGQGRQLTGLVTVAGMGAHHVQVTEDDDYLDPQDDPNDVGAIAVDIVDMDMQDPGRTYVVSAGDASLELFDYQADGDPLGFYYNSDDGSFDLDSTVDGGMDNVPDAKAAIQAVMSDERYANANPYGLAMAYAMGQFDTRQLCASTSNCPVPAPACPAFPGLCDCAICTKLNIANCPACQ